VLLLYFNKVMAADLDARLEALKPKHSSRCFSGAASLSLMYSMKHQAGAEAIEWLSVAKELLTRRITSSSLNKRISTKTEVE